MTLESDIQRLEGVLEALRSKLGDYRTLADCHGRLAWPLRGVYFFWAPDGSRVVRVGTHALTSRSSTTLWNRLSQHRGVMKTGGGNHRGSIFRLLVGEALIRRDDLDYPSWGRGSNASREARAREHELELRVSDYIHSLPFLWLAIEDEPGPDSKRGFIERNAIALLSAARRAGEVEVPEDWLGNWSGRAKVRESGLWNQNHVGETYDPAFLEVMEGLVEQVQA